MGQIQISDVLKIDPTGMKPVLLTLPRGSRKRTSILVLGLLTLSLSLALAQTGTVTGRVIEQQTSLPLPFVNIVVDRTRLGAASKLDGSFVIRNVPAGKQTIRASAVGFQTAAEEASIVAGTTTTVGFELLEAPHTTEEIVVMADAPISAASSTMLGAIDFELRPKLSTQDLLRMVPGLVIAQHAGGGKAEQIFLRGFDADHGTDVNISVDGIPVNMVSHGHGQGYADLHFVMPEVLQGMEVFKGPYFAQFGDFGTAGTVKFFTIDLLDHSTLKAEIGSFGLQRVVGLTNLPLNTDRTTSYVAAEFVNNRSYFEHHQHFTRYNLFGKTKIDVGSGESLALWLSSFGSSWDASGQVPERAVKQGLISRFGAIDPSEGGETYRQNLNLIYSKLSATSSFLAQAFASTYRFQLFSNFTFFREDPMNGDQIEQNDRRTIFGGRAEYNIRSLFGDSNPMTVLGSSFRTDGITVGLWHAAQRKRLKTRADAYIRQSSVALYIQQEYLLASMVRLQIALRADHFIFDVRDRLNPDTPEDITCAIRQTILSPKANLIVSPTADLQLFLNSGMGFHSNDARVVVTQQGNPTLPRALGAEIGARYSLRHRFTTSISFWGLDLEREFVYSGDEGTTEESGPTRRIGVDFDVRAQVLPWLWADGDVSFSRGGFKNLPEGENYIPLGPTLTSTAGLTARHPGGVDASIRFRHVNDRPADEANTVTAKGYTVFDASFSYPLRAYRLTLQAENLFDTEWNEAQFDTESRLRGELEPISELHFTPGTPRSIRVGFSYSF